jgi:hypothetical protein
MLVAQSLDPTVFPQFARLAANFASMEGFMYSSFDAQPAKLFFHLQQFKLPSTFLLELGDQRFQVPA